MSKETILSTIILDLTREMNITLVELQEMANAFDTLGMTETAEKFTSKIMRLQAIRVKLKIQSST